MPLAAMLVIAVLSGFFRTRVDFACRDACSACACDLCRGFGLALLAGSGLPRCCCDELDGCDDCCCDAYDHGFCPVSCRDAEVRQKVFKVRSGKWRIFDLVDCFTSWSIFGQGKTGCDVVEEVSYSAEDIKTLARRLGVSEAEQFEHVFEHSMVPEIGEVQARPGNPRPAQISFRGEDGFGVKELQKGQTPLEWHAKVRGEGMVDRSDVHLPLWVGGF